MIEREVDFERLRVMHCGSCRHEWRVTGDWLELFDQGQEVCPKCGTDSSTEDRPDFWARPEDPSHVEGKVREMSWYHTSTEPNWPARALDPISRLTEVTKERMRAVGSDGKSLERWAERQLAKALHVGTYEAAIENMLRRMSDQDDANEQFYLYRVQLHPESIIEPGVHKEPTNFVGDVVLEEVCTPGVNVYRYVNTREDPSSISLAVNVKAIHSV